MATWQVQDAKARFSEFLNKTLAEGPQIVTRRGVETAILIPIEQWRKIEDSTRPTIKDWLMAPEGRTDQLTPPRRSFPLRSLPNLD